jgi:transcriptional regulator with XRE-family HTH domain
MYEFLKKQVRNDLKTNLTQRQLEKKIGLKRGSIYHFLNVYTGIRDSKIANKIANYYSLSLLREQSLKNIEMFRKKAEHARKFQTFSFIFSFLSLMFYVLTSLFIFKILFIICGILVLISVFYLSFIIDPLWKKEIKKYTEYNR